MVISTKAVSGPAGRPYSSIIPMASASLVNCMAGTGDCAPILPRTRSPRWIGPAATMAAEHVGVDRACPSGGVGRRDAQTVGPRLNQQSRDDHCRVQIGALCGPLRLELSGFVEHPDHRGVELRGAVQRLEHRENLDFVVAGVA